jgi:hypothetical protein
LGATVLLGGEKAGDLGAFGAEVFVAGVEHLGYRSPPGPGGQDALFGQCRRSVRVAQRVDELDGGDVGAGARFGAGRD